MSNKMWGGRFGSGPDPIMEQINASIDFDRHLYRQDIAASKAHAAMLAKTGIITAQDGKSIAQSISTDVVSPDVRALVSSVAVASQSFLVDEAIDRSLTRPRLTPLVAFSPST